MEENKYEEALKKAKAYEDALERAKSAIKECGDNVGRIKLIESIFPDELGENKDEKIRKKLIEYFKGLMGGWFPYSNEEIIAWLEKQGEQKPVIDFKAKDWYVSKVDGKIHDMTYNPADKVEPKFREGDWIVFNGLTLYVKEVVKGFYRTISKGGIPNSYDWDIDNIARLWNIEDAKDGDVLVDVYGNIGIYEKCDDFDWMSYCSLGHNGGFQHFKIEHENEKTYPATKEQRELLFKKMAENGYAWDAEKKELKLLISNGGDF